MLSVTILTELTMLISLLSSVVKSMSDFMADDNADRSKVHVFWNVVRIEGTLENSSRKFYVVVVTRVESIHKSNEFVFKPGLAVNFIP